MLTGKAQIGQHVVLSRLDRRHLLEQILARDEAHRGKEGDHTDTDRIVASVAVAINYAILLAVRLLPPSLRRYAAEHDDGKQLEEGDPLVGRSSLSPYRKMHQVC